MPDKDLTPEELEANLTVVRHIPAWLKHRQVTQDGLAMRLGVSKGSVSKWLHGKQAVTSGQLLAIARLLNVDLRQLFAPPEVTLSQAEFDVVTEILNSLTRQDRARWLVFGKNLAQAPDPEPQLDLGDGPTPFL